METLTIEQYKAQVGVLCEQKDLKEFSSVNEDFRELWYTGRQEGKTYHRMAEELLFQLRSMRQLNSEQMEAEWGKFRIAFGSEMAYGQHIGQLTERVASILDSDEGKYFGKDGGSKLIGYTQLTKPSRFNHVAVDLINLVRMFNPCGTSEEMQKEQLEQMIKYSN